MDATSPLLANLEAFASFVRRRVGDDQLASDIVQESLIKARAHEGDLRDDQRVVPWFYRILRNTIADVQAQRSRDQHRRAPIATGDELEMRPDEVRDTCACLGEVIRTLKPEYADVLQAVELGGEDPEAVADRLGITTNNLKVRRHRAREALRERLQATCRMCATHGCVDCHCKSAHGHR